MFRQYPITLIHLSDKRSFHGGDDTYGWETTMRSQSWGTDYILPSTFHEPLMEHPLRVTTHSLRFETYLEAQLAASEIAVNLARKLIDLPPLPLTRRLWPRTEPT